MVKKIIKLIKILGNPSFAKTLFVYRVAPGVEHINLCRQLDGCKCLVDVGANKGQFSLLFRNYFPEAVIFAFEPLTHPYRIYMDVFHKDKRVFPFNVAIGNSNFTANMHISHREDSSSLLPISPSQQEIFPGTSEIATRQVSVKPISDCLSSHQILYPALLKVDVQGYEMMVLLGCEPILDNILWIYCECSFVELYAGQKLAHEVIGWLASRDYALTGMYNAIYSQGECIQADFLFRKTRQ